MIIFKTGDPVTHKCGGAGDGDMDAIFIRYIPVDYPDQEQRCEVKYISKEKKGKEGNWLAKYAIPRKSHLKSLKERVMDGKPLSTAEQRVYDAYCGSKITPRDISNAKAKLTHIHNRYAGHSRQFKSDRSLELFGCSLVALETAKHEAKPQHDVPPSYDLYKVSDDAAEAIKKGGWPELTSEQSHALDAMKYMAMDFAKPGADCTSVMMGKPALQRQLLDNAVMASHKLKEDNMKAIITETYTDGILTETLINDRNIDDLGSGDLLSYATQAQQAIEKLTKHDGSKCKFINQEHKRLQNFIDSIYVLLDEKFGKKSV